MPKVEINSTAPDFHLLAIDGTDFKLSKFRADKNVMLVFNRGFA